MVVALVAASAPVRAETDRAHAELERRAEAALDELRYEEAFALFEEREREGGLSVDETADLYRRLAEIAATVGDEDAAISYYERLIVVAPNHSLDPRAPAILRHPFERARDRLGPIAGLRASATLDGDTAVVTVARDLLNLVGGAELATAGAVPQRREQGRGEIRLDVSGLEGETLRVFVIDSFGNRLRQVGRVVVPRPRVPAAPVMRPAASTSARASGRSLLARPSVWLASSSVVALGVGVALGATVPARQAEVDSLAASSESHRFEEIERSIDDAERRARHANIAFAVGGTLAVAALISYWIEPAGDGLDVAASGGGGAVAWRRRF